MLFIPNRYKPFTTKMHEGAQGYQYCFEDMYGERYYISIYVYIFYDKYSWQSDCQFTFHSGEHAYKRTFNATLLNDTTQSIHDIEAFFDDIWRKMKCGYYEYKGYYLDPIDPESASPMHVTAIECMCNGIAQWR